MSTIVVMAWSRASANVPGPMPSAGVLRRLKAMAAHRLNRAGCRPVSLAVESWRRPEGVPRAIDNDFLAQMTIATEPGELAGSFACWFQWQHPRWEWSPAPFPPVLTIDTAVSAAAPDFS